MADYLNGLLESKYKNVPFFVRRETLGNIGQKRIKHSYPNSNTQYLEAQGQSVFEETIDIFFKGLNYKNNFDDFKKAIQDPAPGRLFLPTFGIYNNVVALPAQASSDQTVLGEISMTVTFTETIEKPSPTEILNTEEDVATQAQVVRSELQSQFAESYIPPDTRNNIITASSDMKNLATITNDITAKRIEYQAFIRKIDKSLQNASAMATLLLNPGQPLGYLQSIALGVTGTEAFSLYAKIAIAGNNLSNSMNDINSEILPTESVVTPDEYTGTSLNTNINRWDADTVERVERNNNRLVSINIFRVVGLIGMYEQAAEKEYTTTEEITGTRFVLDNYYTEIIENDTTGVVIPEIKNDMEILKNQTEEVLNQKSQSAFNVVEITLKNIMPATLLAYKLYGEYLKTIAEFEYVTGVLISLNSSLPAHKLSGIVKVLEIG